VTVGLVLHESTELGPERSESRDMDEKRGLCGSACGGFDCWA
jgi:hypothetical protein